jgi:SP family myo-inositol transporter-like MFS transporter 13
MLPMKRRFDLDTWQEEVVVSSTVLAAFLSSLAAGSCLNALGRRVSILLAASVFTIGSCLLLTAWSYRSLVLGRVVVGMGIGIASLTTPIYIAEVAAPSLRGQLVTVNALLVTIGQFVAGMVDGVLDQLMPQVGWRLMLGLAAVPSLIMLVGFWHLPESPRWLAFKGRKQEALAILKTLRESDAQAEQELHEILQSVRTFSHEDGEGLELAAETPSNTLEYGSTTSVAAISSLSTTSPSEPSILQRFRLMFADPPTRRALVVGCGLMAVQQCSGINTVRVIYMKRARRAEPSQAVPLS